MHETITCRWCGQPIGTNYFEVFDHINCTRLEVAVPPEAAAESTGTMTPEELRRHGWQLEKTLNRTIRTLERLQRR
jgi:hypothetical protein